MKEGVRLGRSVRGFPGVVTLLEVCHVYQVSLCHLVHPTSQNALGWERMTRRQKINITRHALLYTVGTLTPTKGLHRNNSWCGEEVTERDRPPGARGLHN